MSPDKPPRLDYSRPPPARPRWPARTEPWYVFSTLVNLATLFLTTVVILNIHDESAPQVAFICGIPCTLAQVLGGALPLALVARSRNIPWRNFSWWEKLLLAFAVLSTLAVATFTCVTLFAH